MALKKLSHLSAKYSRKRRRTTLPNRSSMVFVTPGIMFGPRVFVTTKHPNSISLRDSESPETSLMVPEASITPETYKYRISTTRISNWNFSFYSGTRPSVVYCLRDEQIGLFVGEGWEIKREIWLINCLPKILLLTWKNALFGERRGICWRCKVLWSILP